MARVEFQHSPPSILGGTTGTNINPVLCESSSVADTSPCAAEFIRHNHQDQAYSQEPPQPFNDSPTEHALDRSPSMSTLFTHTKGNSHDSVVLQFDNDNNDDDPSTYVAASPLTFAVRDLDTDDDYNEINTPEHSPVTFAPPELDYGDDYSDIVYYRRVSWPMVFPSSVSLSEESQNAKFVGKTLKRQSRSLGTLDLPTTDDVGPIVGSLNKTNWDTPSQHAQSNELDIQYILSAQVDGRSSKRSSSALSYVQRPRKVQDTSYLLSLRRMLAGATRPPSSPGVGNEDSFTKILEKWDSGYDARKDYWTIKRQDNANVHDQNASLAMTGLTLKGGLNDSLGRMSLGKGKGKDKHTANKGMAPGTEEIWKCGFVGKFRVHRVSHPFFEGDPMKSPHQRLNLFRITDPTGDAETQSGPNMVIHKHSRTIAFSIVRAYGFGKSDKLGPGILLAPRNVQERFTATRNTSKLATHGLLEDDSRPHRHRDHDRKGKNREDNDLKEITSTATANVFSGDSLVLDDAAVHTPFSAQVSIGEPSGSNTSWNPPAVLTDSLVDTTIESISDHSTIRSLHAYARPVLHRRSSSEFWPPHRPVHTSKVEPVPSSFFKRWLRPHPRHPSGQKSPTLGGDFKAPWMTMSGRSKQEDADRAIGKLNESLQMVGMAPISTKLPGKPKQSRPKAGESTGILGHLSEDTLLMILPLWSIQSRQAGRHEMQTPTLEDRCYLIVYYVPFMAQQKGSKKPKRLSPSSSVETPKSFEDKNVLLSEFRVCACLVNFAELRGSGVRLPSDGLLVSCAGEAMRYPKLMTYGVGDPHGLVIGVYHGRTRGVEFVPEGFKKLGLCVAPRQSVGSYGEEGFEDMRLSELGRAVVEMVWAGCMALSSFGHT